MEFRQLRTFRTVADLLSFTRSAERLHMAQSSVSSQIRSLESELGVKLFDRIGRRVLLTDAGRTLYDYARRIEGMTDEIRSEVSGTGAANGSLTVRVPETIASVYMPAVVNQFCQEYPAVRLNFINCTDRRLQKELNTGRIDLAFLIVDAVHMGDVTVRMLTTEPLALVAGPSHPLAGRSRVALDDLAGHTLLLPRTDWSYRRAFERSLDQHHIPVKRLDFSSITSMRRCLTRGIGITLCPEIAMARHLTDGRLVKLAWSDPGSDTPVLMIWHSEKWCSPLLKGFMDIAQAVIGD